MNKKQEDSRPEREELPILIKGMPWIDDCTHFRSTRKKGSNHRHFVLSSSGSHVEYANYICWISNTYYVPFESTLPARHDERPKHIGECRVHRRLAAEWGFAFPLAYYQWIPFILLLMSVLFYIPSILWHALATKTGFDIANLVKTLHSMEQLNPDIRDRTLRYIAKHIDRALEIQREMGTGFFSQFKRALRRYCPVLIIGRAQGNYLTFIYLFVKLLYITNVIGQLFLLNVSSRRRSDHRSSASRLYRSSWVRIIMVMALKFSIICYPVGNVAVHPDFLE